MTSTKEYYDEHVVGKSIDWNDLVENSSTQSEEPFDRALGPGNLTKWCWKNLDGYIPSHLAKQIREKHPRIEQLRDGRARAKTKQHARQGKKQHKAVQPRNRLQRQPLQAGGGIAAQYQGKKGKGDTQDF